MAIIETKIPLFPLSMILLPGERRALHIFEPRYKELLADIKKGSGYFGIPHFNDEKQESEVVYGSVVKLVQVVKDYPGGESDIVIECMHLFELRSFELKLGNKAYPGGMVALLSKYKSWPLNPLVKEEFEKLVKVLEPASTIFPSLESTFDVLMRLEMSDKERVEFLKMSSRKAQEKKMIGLMKFSTLILQQEKKKEFDFFMN